MTTNYLHPSEKYTRERSLFIGTLSWHFWSKVHFLHSHILKRFHDKIPVVVLKPAAAIKMQTTSHGGNIGLYPHTTTVDSRPRPTITQTRPMYPHCRPVKNVVCHKKPKHICQTWNTDVATLSFVPLFSGEGSFIFPTLHFGSLLHFSIIPSRDQNMESIRKLDNNLQTRRGQTSHWNQCRLILGVSLNRSTTSWKGVGQI